MVKSKTSIYVDKDLWQRFRRQTLRRGLEVSEALESMMEEEMVDELIDRMFSKMSGLESHEVDFNPVKLKGESVSDLVRAMRYERASSLLG